MLTFYLNPNFYKPSRNKWLEPRLSGYVDCIYIAVNYSEICFLLFISETLFLLSNRISLKNIQNDSVFSVFRIPLRRDLQILQFGVLGLFVGKELQKSIWFFYSTSTFKILSFFIWMHRKQERPHKTLTCHKSSKNTD